MAIRIRTRLSSIVVATCLVGTSVGMAVSSEVVAEGFGCCGVDCHHGHFEALGSFFALVTLLALAVLFVEPIEQRFLSYGLACYISFFLSTFTPTIAVRKPVDPRSIAMICLLAAGSVCLITALILWLFRARPDSLPGRIARLLLPDLGRPGVRSAKMPDAPGGIGQV